MPTLYGHKWLRHKNKTEGQELDPNSVGIYSKLWKKFTWLHFNIFSALVVKTLLAADANAIASGDKTEPKQVRFAHYTANTIVQFEKAEGAAINLTGKSMG